MSGIVNRYNQHTEASERRAFDEGVRAAFEFAIAGFLKGPTFPLPQSVFVSLLREYLEDFESSAASTSEPPR